MNSPAWLLLLYGLPAKSGAARLSLWRQLKRLGAVSLKTSAYVLPDTAPHYEAFQWLGQRVREQGGEATLIRAAEVDGLSDAQIISLFQEARDADYTEWLEEAKQSLPGKSKGRGKDKAASPPADTVEKLTARLQAIRQVDFFTSPKGTEAESVLQKLRGAEGADKSRRHAIKDFQKRRWLTRPRPEVDRVASAWLIRKWIDPEAEFVFASDASGHPDAIPYDMTGVEFGHQGDRCTFETLVRVFGLSDAGVQRIAETVHDADLDDGRYGTQEGAGLLCLFRGWAQMGWSDAEILQRGFECLDALHAHFTAKGRKPNKR